MPGGLFDYVTQFIRLDSWVSMGKILFDRVLKEGGVWHLYGHSWQIEEMGLWDDLKEMLDYVSNRGGVAYMPNRGLLELLPTGSDSLPRARPKALEVKILLVHNAYRQPGGEDVVFEQERQVLEGAGHQVVTYRRSNHEVNGDSLAGQLALASKVVWAADSRREFAAMLRREKPQIVHIHNTFVVISPSIYSACREAGVPVVQTLHNYRLLCPAANFFRQDRICEECVEHSLWRGVLHGCYRDSRAATSAVALMLAVHRWRRTWSWGVDRFVALSEFSRAEVYRSRHTCREDRLETQLCFCRSGMPGPKRRICAVCRKALS